MFRDLLFRRVEVWLVLVGMFFGLMGAWFFGWLVYRTFAKPHGRVQSDLAVSIASLPDTALMMARSGLTLDPEGRISLKKFQIGEFSEFSGLLREEEGFVDDGVLLVSAYNADEMLSTVYLYDITTEKVLHEWVPNFSQILEKFPPPEPSLPNANVRRSFQSQHPWLLEDGHIVITSGGGVLARLDQEGNLVWLRDEFYHHSIERMANGNFIVPNSKVGEQGERRDGYAIVSPDGELLHDEPVIDLLDRHGHRGLLFGAGEWHDDILHLNDAEPIHEDDEFVKKGDVLLSLRSLSTVLHYRPSEDRILWLQTGPWCRQHDVDYLGGGQFLIFGNDYIHGRGWIDAPHSNLYQYDMTSQEVTKPFDTVFSENELGTPTQGLQQMLANGDVFVSLTDTYQLLRVSPQGVRWRYVHNTGPNEVGALHWSRYLPASSPNLSWLLSPN